MSALDYYAIASAIGTTLDAADSLDGVRFIVEEDFPFGVSDDQKMVGIYCDGRTPTELQSLSAGKRTRFHIQVRLWCVAFSMESIRHAIELRDDLIGAVELALMENRTFGRSEISSSWLNGGELSSAKNPGSGQFIAVGEVLLIIEATAINA